MYLVHYCLVSLNHHQVHTAIMKIKRILTTQLGSLYLKKYQKQNSHIGSHYEAQNKIRGAFLHMKQNHVSTRIL